MSDVLTLKQAAALAGVPQYVIKDFVKTGVLEPFENDGKTLFHLDELNVVISMREVERAQEQLKISKERVQARRQVEEWTAKGEV